MSYMMRSGERTSVPARASWGRRERGAASAQRTHRWNTCEARHRQCLCGFQASGAAEKGKEKAIFLRAKPLSY